MIQNWADTSAIEPGPRDNAFARAHGLVDRFVVMHSGNLGLSQSLETLVDAAALLRDRADVRLVFQGEGVKKAELEARVGALGLTNVLFLPFAPQAQLGESFAAADVFVVSLQRGLAGYIVPSKLYGILAAGRPYIAAVEADVRGGVACDDARSAALVAEPGNARALADAILTCRADRDRLGHDGRQRAGDRGIRSTARAQVARYFEVFSAATRRERPGTVAAAEEEAHVGRG